MSSNSRRWDGSRNPNYKDGRKGTRLYRIYHNMLSRCYNPNVRSYKSYGGRGVTVCEEWRSSFETFKAWSTMNDYSENLTLDRSNNNEGYSPDNCRWVTYREQSLNTTRNHLVELDGVVKPLDEWSKCFGINPKTVRSRLRNGWSYERALNSPVDVRWSH